MRNDNPTIVSHLQQVRPQQCAVSIFPATEQASRRLPQRCTIQAEQDALLRFRLVQATLLFYRDGTILSYTYHIEKAVARFVQLRQAKLRIGTQKLVHNPMFGIAFSSLTFCTMIRTNPLAYNKKSHLDFLLN